MPLMRKDLQYLKAVNVSDIVEIREVGLRDGLQLIKTQLTTQQKLQWVKKQVKAGFTEIEVTSFVPPKLLPQFSDANEMVISSNKIQNLKATALVLNLKGATNPMEPLPTPKTARKKSKSTKKTQGQTDPTVH